MNALPSPFDISKNKDLLQLVEEVQDTKKPRLLNRENEPVAAVVPLEMYEQWEKDREKTFRALFAIMDEAADNANLSDEQAEKLTQETVAAVRAKNTPGRLTP